MSIDKGKSVSAAAKLRRRAEEQLDVKASETGFSRTEDGAQRLVHELEVHQIELEMQNAELRQVREELERSLGKYTELYDFAPVGYFTLNRNGDISSVNLCGASILGIERARLLGRRFGLFVTKEYRPAFISFLGTAFTSQGKEECEVALQNERNLPLFVQIEAVAAASGQESHLVVIDITKRKQMETELRESEQSFRTLSENSPGIIVRYDRECRRIYVNPAYELETETSRDQAVGVLPDSNWAAANMPVEEYRLRLQQTIETGVAAEMLLEWIKQDGQRVSHDIHVVAERDSAGIVIGCLALGHKVTLLKAAEQRLAKLAENSPGAMFSYLLRPDGTSCMPYVSTRIKELIGLRPEELAIDMSEAYAIIHPGDAMRVQKSIAESVRTLSPWHTEFRVRHPEKGEIWLEGHAMPEPQQDGSCLWYGFLHEITERKQIDESLRAKQEQLATMSVEVSLAEERERRRIASELHDHIGQTLLLSRIKLGTLADVFESGGGKTYGEILSLLDQTIRDIRSLTQQLNPPMLASLGIEVALQWLARRMEADYSLLVEFAADRSEKQLTEELSAVVYQSARELLINVTKHSGTSKAQLSISRDADMLILAVEDQGIGFACFTDAGTNMSPDCSFGLFNIRQRIEFLGGSVMVESTPGSGTRVTIRVPVLVGR